MNQSDIQAAIIQGAVAQGLDPQVALAQAKTESAYNPNAYNPTSGAAGLFQFEPATAAQYGITNPYDPMQSINGRNSYYANLLTQFNGDEASALAAYDWGPSRVRTAQSRYGADWLSYAPTETQKYVSSILGSVSSAAPPSVSLDATDNTNGQNLSADIFPGFITPAQGPSLGFAVGIIALAAGLWFVSGEV